MILNSTSRCYWFLETNSPMMSNNKKIPFKDAFIELLSDYGYSIEMNKIYSDEYINICLKTVNWDKDEDFNPNSDDFSIFEKYFRPTSNFASKEDVDKVVSCIIFEGNDKMFKDAKYLIDIFVQSKMFTITKK